MKIVFATGNRHKLEEVQRMLGPAFELLTPQDCGLTEDIPEEQPTIEGNALQKARYVREKTGLDCFADDTGLEVDALGGEPGVRSARYAGEAKDDAANMRLLLSRLAGRGNRRARFRTAIALILNGEEHVFEGEVKGTIRQERSGEGGFGYDPLFQPDGFGVTFAEMDMETKNGISHRGRAVRKLVDFLQGKADG